MWHATWCHADNNLQKTPCIVLSSKICSSLHLPSISPSLSSRCRAPSAPVLHRPLLSAFPTSISRLPAPIPHAARPQPRIGRQCPRRPSPPPGTPTPPPRTRILIPALRPHLHIRSCPSMRSRTASSWCPVGERRPNPSPLRLGPQSSTPASLADEISMWARAGEGRRRRGAANRGRRTAIRSRTGGAELLRYEGADSDEAPCSMPAGPSSCTLLRTDCLLHQKVPYASHS
ncbi:hypothetical protein PVAP13_3KG542401 [Panicum virgatum]|uniref:Uncharacterized protein n=1 Tax=Panicum virgatum TaxID=38727 RepID=A0A8T0VFY7_PANVG|nr:hypothetical protein PVAP13_3KG542401 [Panicum virgatum]